LADDPVGGVRSDLYSLTATLYTLLARRSPFEIPGRSNEMVDLLSRIPRVPATPTGNPQTPRSLERVLARGLAKDPALRYPSALVLARALQDVETELGGSVTNVEFLDENPTAALAEMPGEQADHTRIRPLVIRAQTDRDSTGRATDFTSMRNRPAKSDPAAQGAVEETEHTQLRGRPSTGGYLDPDYLSAPVPADTVVPSRPESATATPADAAEQKSRIPVLAGLVAGLVVIGGLAWILVTQGTDAPQVPNGTTVPTETALAIDVLVPPPTDLTGTPGPDGVVFTWTNPDPKQGDSYDWHRTDPGADPSVARVQDPTVTVTGAQTPCILVEIVRDDGSASAHGADACVGQ
jgi:hypothetical protein